jgi:hypothetical protein
MYYNIKGVLVLPAHVEESVPTACHKNYPHKKILVYSAPFVASFFHLGLHSHGRSLYIGFHTWLIPPEKKTRDVVSPPIPPILIYRVLLFVTGGV